VAVTAKLYGNYVIALHKKEIDWANDNIAVTLHQVGYVPDQDVHDYANDLTSEVPNTGGYTTGGKVLTGKTMTYTAGTNTITLDANDLQWASSTITARVAVIKDDTPATAAAKPLIGYQLSDADISSSGGNYDLVWNASGIASFVVA
jgi:hypothetical protein